MNRLKLLLYILVAFSVGGCKNDIDIYTPWVETPIVYGLLDVNQTTQYIRIEKTYQNDVHLTTAQGAQYSDSLYFKNLVVKVTSGTNTYTFDKIGATKDPGFFANDQHYLYAANIANFDPTKTYNLSIYSPETGKTYTGTTALLGKATLGTYFLNFNTVIIPSYMNITFIQASGTYSLDALLRFRYREYPTGDSSNPAYFSMDYKIPADYINTSTGRCVFPNLLFINFIKDQIPLKAGYDREIVAVDFNAVSGSKALQDLIDVTIPSSSIVQKKTDYTNIAGGALGIFSSRSNTLFQNLDIVEKPGNNQRQNLINALNAEPKNLRFVH